VAAVVGVTPSAVSCWETGVREIPVGDNLLRLADLFGLEPSELVKVDGEGGAPRGEVQLLAAFRALPEDRQLVAIRLLEALK
jgi:transcriptional regulator with XRE-family HTH domain